MNTAVFPAWNPALEARYAPLVATLEQLLPCLEVPLHLPWIDAINTLIDCFVLEDLACARGVVDTRSKSRAVVYTRAETTQNPDGTRDIAISGYWFQKDRHVLAERRVCTRCNDESLHATVDELMLALAWELANADGSVDRLEEAFHAGLARRLGVSAPRAAELREALSAELV